MLKSPVATDVTNRNPPRSTVQRPDGMRINRPMVTSAPLTKLQCAFFSFVGSGWDIAFSRRYAV